MIISDKHPLFKRIKDSIEFNVYPENKSIYYNVTVFDKYADARDYVQLRFGKWHHDNRLDRKDRSFAFAALTEPYTIYDVHDKTKKQKLHPCMGEIVFCKEQRFDAVVIAHEALHAAIFYVLRKGWTTKEINSMFIQEMEAYGNKEIDMQEKFCHIQGNIIEQIYKKYNQLEMDLNGITAPGTKGLLDSLKHNKNNDR